MEKLILDATCGSRMIWFNKNNPYVLYVDRRIVEDEVIWQDKTDERNYIRLNIRPDVVADFTCLPFEDNTFYHVVFDPPHLKHLGENSWLCKKYGSLPQEWEKVIHDGFTECMRVLKPNGTLVFKWNEDQISLKDVLKAIGQKPLYGNRSGKHMKTIWMCFIKTE